MSKLKMHSPDLTAANIERLVALFPNCVTESADDKGQLRQSIDFDLLRQELSNAIVEGPVERYTLNWPGKREAIVAANTPVYKTLRPCADESVNFATTKNLYIEGDNLEGLKLLQETYLGKIKMIYIDPPYNTGNDFIYEDDFAEDVEIDLLKSSQKDESGGRLVSNQTSNGRFHSDWLTMMYPRLKLARDLLTEDGIIFISIDDNEQANLKKICDEIFGTDKFIAQMIWKSRQNKDNRNKNNVSIDHEYVFCYGNKLRGATRDLSGYLNPDNDKRGQWTSANMVGLATESERPNLHYDLINPETGVNYGRPAKGWRYDKNTMGNLIKEKRILWPPSPGGRPRKKQFLSDLTTEYTGLSSLIAGDFYTSDGTRELVSTFGVTLFAFPKCTELVQLLAQQAGDSRDAIVLDFFSGSATTAHAVMQLNAEDGGNRRFIMVQLPEVCDAKSEAFKAGYKNICEIGKERIRRAGQKIKDENATNAPNLDVGFRVFKVDSSNMKDVYYTPDALEQSKLDLFADAIKEDRTAEDILFQVFLDCGLDLALPVTKETIEGKTIYIVDQNVLMACFASDIPESLIRALAKRQPLKAVFLDRSFVRDSTKLNVTQIFKQLAPNTEVKTI